MNQLIFQSIRNTCWCLYCCENVIKNQRVFCLQAQQELSKIDNKTYDGFVLGQKKLIICIILHILRKKFWTKYYDNSQQLHARSTRQNTRILWFPESGNERCRCCRFEWVENFYFDQLFGRECWRVGRVQTNKIEESQCDVESSWKTVYHISHVNMLFTMDW